MSVADGPRSLKDRQREERERLILEAAEELLAEKGYHEMSIDDIAARVGVSKGTVYLHFPSKGAGSGQLARHATLHAGGDDALTHRRRPAPGCGR
jgi:AcrR family transcriptional regulator